MAAFETRSEGTARGVSSLLRSRPDLLASAAQRAAPRILLSLVAEHRRMVGLQHLAIAEIHVHAARQTRIEAAYGAHDVDALEFVRPILFEDRRVLHRILVRARGSVNIARIGVPGRGRIRMIVCDFAVANYDVVREYSAHRFVEAAGNRVVRNFEVVPGFRPPGVQFRESLLGEIKRAASRVTLEVSPRPI